LSDYFKDAFIFDLENRVVGGFTEKNDFISIDDMQRLILGLLQDKEIKRPSLGVTYSNLSEFAIKDTAYEKGALLVSSDKKPAVKPGSAAELAGLKEGDIILSVNNATLNADWDLADLLKKYSAGEEIDILYSRAGEEKIAKVILGELK
jgi:S1-C subfamily serine protease